MSVDGSTAWETWLRCVWARQLSSEDAEVVLSTGKVLSECRLPCFAGGKTRVPTKCYDLEAAYKRCPLAYSEGSVGVIAVEDPDNPEELKYSRIYALTFGAVRSVLQFNQLAVAIRQIAVCFFRAAICQQVSTTTLFRLPDSIAAMGEAEVKSLGPLTGWRWKGGDKDRPFNVRCKALGIMFHLKRVLTESCL